MNAGSAQRIVKSFMAPVWIMGSIAAVRMIILANTFLAMRQLQLRHGAGFNKFAFLSGSILICIALAEAIVYWRIRRRKYNRTSARIHLLLMLVAMVVLPLLFICFARIGRYYLNSAHFVDWIRKFGRLQLYVFWICFISASILFVSFVIKSYSSREGELEDMVDSIGDD